MSNVEHSAESDRGRIYEEVRAEMAADKRREGLHGKFYVERLTPSSRGIDHSECAYFVLDPQHDPIAQAALARYAQVARAEGYGPLADDLEAWLTRVTAPVVG